jgi:hypothetical protein
MSEAVTELASLAGVPLTEEEFNILKCKVNYDREHKLMIQTVQKQQAQFRANGFVGSHLMRDHVLSQNYEQFLNYEKAKQSAVANPNFDTLPPEQKVRLLEKEQQFRAWRAKVISHMSDIQKLDHLVVSPAEMSA